MIPAEDDIFYAARLVLDTRLLLTTVLREKYSEQFFINMCRIAAKGIWKGYMTHQGMDVTFQSVMGFLLNTRYGLGITDLTDFMGKINRLALQDNSKQQFAVKFLEWLAKQDEKFAIPEHVWEYRRVLREINGGGLGLKSSTFKPRGRAIARGMFETHPELLRDIGYDRKHTNIFEAGKLFLDYTAKEKMTELRIFKNPTALQVERTGHVLYKIIGYHKSKLLIKTMLELCLRSKEAREEKAWQEANKH